MMANAKAIYLYLDYLELFGGYTMEQRGRLVTAMLEYATTGVIPEFDGPEIYVWPVLRGQLDRDREKYEAKCKRNAENARNRHSEQSATKNERYQF